MSNNGVDRTLVAPAAIIGAWAIAAAAAAVQAIALVRLDGRVDMLHAILGRISIIPLWAIATPFILRSARRFPVVRDHGISPASMAAHLALGSLFVVVTNIAIRIPMVFGDGGLGALVRGTAQGVAEFYPPAMVVYGVIVAIGHFLFRPPVAGQHPIAAVGPVPSAGVSVDAIDETYVLPPSKAADAGSTSAVAAMNGHLTVRQWNRVHLVRVDDIDFVEAEDNYVVVHAGARAYKGRERISDVEAQLDSHRFVRIHRSTIVQVGKIREVQPLTHGDHAVVLRDGKVLRVARSRRQALEQALGIEL